MYFGDLWNFLDLSHRFYKFQLLLTELLQCSITCRGPSKTVSFFEIEEKVSRLAFLSLSNHAVRRHRIQALYELANFSCHNAAQFSIFNLLSLLFTVTCLRLPGLTQTVAD